MINNDEGDIDSYAYEMEDALDKEDTNTCTDEITVTTTKSDVWSIESSFSLNGDDDDDANSIDYILTGDGSFTSKEFEFVRQERKDERLYFATVIQCYVRRHLVLSRNKAQCISACSIQNTWRQYLELKQKTSMGRSHINLSSNNSSYNDYIDPTSEVVVSNTLNGGDGATNIDKDAITANKDNIYVLDIMSS